MQGLNISTAMGRRTMGVDLSDQSFTHTLVSEQGEVVSQGSTVLSLESVRNFFSALPAMRVVLESGTGSRWFAQVVRECGHETLVANPRQLALIYGSKRKTDRRDSETLARLGRLDPSLLRPIRQRGSEAQLGLSLLKARDTLVRRRGDLIRTVRSLVKESGGRLRSCSAEVFGNRIKDEIPGFLRPVAEPLVASVDFMTRQIRRLERRIAALAKSLPETDRLRDVKGVGPVTSLAFVLTVEDPRRFAKSRAVGAYFGLAPAKDQSGESDPRLRISKEGDGYVRRLLITCAHYILGPFGQDCDLRRHGEKILLQGGRDARKRAAVAVARKLAVLLHALWVGGQPYDPLLNSRGAQA